LEKNSQKTTGGISLTHTVYSTHQYGRNREFYKNKNPTVANCCRYKYVHLNLENLELRVFVVGTGLTAPRNLLCYCAKW